MKEETKAEPMVAMKKWYDVKPNFDLGKLTEKLKDVEELCGKREDEYRDLWDVVQEKKRRAEQIQNDVV